MDKNDIYKYYFFSIVSVKLLFSDIKVIKQYINIDCKN